MKFKRIPVFFLVFLFGIASWGRQIFTNAVIMPDAPQWVKRTQVEKIVDRIQYKLEWSTRRIQVHWHATQASFEKVHGLGNQALAVSITSSKEQTIHLGPRVTEKNFETVFAHEMVHIILFQKYKEAIPKWLTEGLANFLAQKGKVDYKWLASQPFPKDVRKMVHPFKESPTSVQYHYMASQALAEMLDKKCDFENLIRLSVERNMEDYIRTFCEIKDLNLEFQNWVKKKSQK